MNNRVTSSKPEKTWMSSFLFVFGTAAVIAAIFAFFTGSFLLAFASSAIAALFFGLGRALDYLKQILIRLDQRKENDKEDEDTASVS